MDFHWRNNGGSLGPLALFVTPPFCAASSAVTGLFEAVLPPDSPYLPPRFPTHSHLHHHTLLPPAHQPLSLPRGTPTRALPSPAPRLIFIRISSSFPVGSLQFPFTFHPSPLALPSITPPAPFTATWHRHSVSPANVWEQFGPILGDCSAAFPLGQWFWEGRRC